MAKIVKIFVGILLIVIVSNFVKIPSIGQSYSFQTEKQEFTYRCIPSKGRKEIHMIRAFNEFKKKNPEYEDLILYRTFEKKWWKFWNWREYLLVKRWKYPFLNSIK